MTQAQFEAALTEALAAKEFGLSKRDVRDLLDTQAEVVAAALKHTKAKPAEPVTIRGLGKLSIKEIPAKPRRKGINPFTKEEQWFAAKPKSRKVRVTVAKALRDGIGAK